MTTFPFDKPDGRPFDINEPLYMMSVAELRAIYRIVEHQYISYEDVEAHEVTRKIMRILKEHELAGRNRAGS